MLRCAKNVCMTCPALNSNTVQVSHHELHVPSPHMQHLDLCQKSCMLCNIGYYAVQPTSLTVQKVCQQPYLAVDAYQAHKERAAVTACCEQLECMLCDALQPTSLTFRSRILPTAPVSLSKLNRCKTLGSMERPAQLPCFTAWR